MLDNIYIEDYYSKLKRLPRAVQRCENAEEAYGFNEGSLAHRFFQNAYESYERWEVTQNPLTLWVIGSAFNNSAQEYERLGNISMQSIMLVEYSRACFRKENHELGLKILLHVVAINKYSNRFKVLHNLVYEELGLVACELLKIKNEYIDDGEDIAAAKINSLLIIIRRQLIDLDYCAVGLPVNINREAYRVEQGEAGYSSSELIGTDNINDCVCVLIWNPVTKKVALAHVDRGVDINSLWDVIGNIDTGEPLQVKLVGARKFEDDNDTAIYNR